MEVGKLKTDSTPIFYFIIDSASPDAPNASRLQHYFVTTEIDSYVEAFYFVCRSLCSPPSDASLRRWHNLYSKVFGSVSFDSFVKSVQTLPMKHFSLDTSEGAARNRIAEMKKGLQRHRDAQETNLLVYPRRDDNGDAQMELHRLKSEFGELQGQLRIEKTKQKVTGLSDAERSALLYKLEQAQQDAETERSRAKETTERMRTVIRSLQDRLDTLIESHERTLREQHGSEKEVIAAVEKEFLKREEEMQRQFEEAVREREKRLHKAVAKARAVEEQMKAAMGHLENDRTEIGKLRKGLGHAKEERESLKEELRRAEVDAENLNRQLQDRNTQLNTFEGELQKSDAELVKARQEAQRWRREAERYAEFTASLQFELRDLDNSSATAVDLLRKRVMKERRPSY